MHAGDLNTSKMLFPEDYHNISLVFKAAQLMKQQDPTRVVPGEHKLHFNLLHLHVCFYCWVGCAWHCIFVLDKRLGQHSFLGLECHFYFLTSRGAQEENVALSCFISFVDFSIAFWKASRCSVWHILIWICCSKVWGTPTNTWSKENTPVKTKVLCPTLTWHWLLFMA